MQPVDRLAARIRAPRPSVGTARYHPQTIPPITFTGAAVSAKMKLSTDQPPNAAWAISFDCGEGRL